MHGFPSNAEVLITDQHGLLYSPSGASEAASYVGGGGPMTAHLELDLGRQLAFASIGEGAAQQAIAIILYVVNDRFEPGGYQLIPDMAEVSHAVVNSKTRQIYVIGHKTVGSTQAPRAATTVDNGFNWSTTVINTPSRLVGLATIAPTVDTTLPTVRARSTKRGASIAVPRSCPRPRPPMPAVAWPASRW